MQVRADQLASHLAKGLRSLYTVWGDEPLLAQEALDALRSAARAAGCTERQVHTVSGVHFDWSSMLGAARELSLFSDRQLIEIRIPSGKPGKEGSDALKSYCDTVAAGGTDTVTLVALPRLDRAQQASAWFSALDRAGVTIRIDAIERKALPQWIAQRLARRGQRVPGGQAGQQALAFFADRVEGNLLAAHQEIEKLALLYPSGELSFEQIESAVLNVARYDVFKLGEAVLTGQVGRALRMLEGLQAEGQAAVLVHWAIAEDIRALKQIEAALRAGQPLPLALREARVWGPRERLVERALPLFAQQSLALLLDAASVCDGVVKGLRDPDWPDDPWQALQKLVLMLLQHTTPVAARQALRLALMPTLPAAARAGL
ncbi:MAG: DNA polymerase III subunit delta [Burkholderiaceae bacterium]